MKLRTFSGSSFGDGNTAWISWAGSACSASTWRRWPAATSLLATYHGSAAIPRPVVQASSTADKLFERSRPRTAAGWR